MRNHADLPNDLKHHLDRQPHRVFRRLTTGEIVPREPSAKDLRTHCRDILFELRDVLVQLDSILELNDMKAFEKHWQQKHTCAANARAHALVPGRPFEI